MLLRHLLTNFVRQTAQQKLRDAVSERAAAGGEAADPPPQADIVCVFALGAEAGGLVDLLHASSASRCNTFFEYAGDLGGRRLAVIETGVGEAAAARATRDAIAIHEPSWVISAGFAGALEAGLKRGHLLMPDQLVRHSSGEQLDVGLRLDAAQIEATPKLHSGKLLTVDKLVRTSQEKQKLGDQHGAVACDMESFAVAEVCREAKVRFLSVRIISDALEDELPVEVERLLDQDSLASKLGAATGAIFRRPSSIKDMWALKEQAIKASDRLARFLTGTIAQLPITG